MDFLSVHFKHQTNTLREMLAIPRAPQAPEEGRRSLPIPRFIRYAQSSLAVKNLRLFCFRPTFYELVHDG